MLEVRASESAYYSSADFIALIYTGSKKPLKNLQNVTRKIIVGVVLLLIAGLTYLAVQFWYDTSVDEESAESVIVTIPNGAGFGEILDSLEVAGLISDRASFRILASATGADDELKSGTYKFQRGLSQARLLDALKDGHSTVRVKVTFPEGVTIRRIASIAAEKAGLDSAEFVRLANDREYLKSIGLNASTAEGYLMPDTYFLYWGEPADLLLKRMSGLFLEFYDQAKKASAEKLNLTPYEAIILASLVEGEARVDKDRPIVARLYLNRLERGMRLEADPTIQYILPDGPRRLLYEDLRVESPYNSYKYKGLPPTPINNPGRKSITAALNPSDHDYIFMVAKGDGSGAHTFSTTKSQHDRAVREYRRNLGR